VHQCQVEDQQRLWLTNAEPKEPINPPQNACRSEGHTEPCVHSASPPVERLALTEYAKKACTMLIPVVSFTGRPAT